MSPKAKYFIVYKHGMEDQIQWPKGWGNTCRGNIHRMLQELLHVDSIGSELKLIWNSAHERIILTDYNITHQQLNDYLNAKCGTLIFKSKKVRNHAEKALKKMGAENLALVDNYRDVLLCQAHYYNHGEFPELLKNHFSI